MVRQRVGAVCAIGIALVCLAYLLAVPLGLVSAGGRLQLHEVVLAAVLLGGAAFAASSYSITDFTVGSGGVSARLARTEERQRRLEDELHALRVALSGVVTKFEWGLLRLIAAEEPALVRFRDDMKLQAEVVRLDAMGFLTPLDPRGLNAIVEDHGHGGNEFDLKRYVAVTDAGREYLRLRDQLR